MKLTGTQRFELINLIPPEVGSLKESLAAGRLRDELSFTDEEKETLEMEGNSFNPQRLADIEPKTIDLDDAERKVIAYGFLFDQQNESVKTNDAYLMLLREFEDDIDEIQSD